jgi:hypothetical protein
MNKLPYIFFNRDSIHRRKVQKMIYYWFKCLNISKYLKGDSMKKAISVLFLGFFAMGMVASPLYSWGSATHVYIVDQIGKKFGLRNMNEIYGAASPDLFNYLFGTAYQRYLHDQTHGVSGDESFLKLWWAAKRWGFQKSLAYGFVSHNDVWAADFTAHHEAQTIPDPGVLPEEYDPGWVIVQAFDLNAIWGLAEYLWSIKKEGVPDNVVFSFAIEICHNIIEAAGDVVMVEEDPLLGMKLSSSALLRDSSFPELLVDAYADDFAFQYDMTFETAAQIIRDAEKEFRKMMILLGTALMQDKETARQLLAQQMADLAQAYLETDFNLPSYNEIFLKLDEGLKYAIDLCETGNSYLDEVQETIKFVRSNLLLNRIYYF